MIVRIFHTAVDPDDVDKGIAIFLEHVKPTFESFEGCTGIEWYVGVEEHSADLVDVAALSRWESLEHIEPAVSSLEYETALSQLRELFRQTPIVHHYRAAE
jgi:quinol monooxygenase YgiN